MDQISLSVDEFPKSWYNILPDLPKPLPPPKNPEDAPSRLESFPILKTALRQELSDQRWIPIPDELRELYLQAGRPRPLHRASRLERYLGTPARLYYKREDLSPTGSHKVNTALAQLYYAREEGFERVTTETGAGQWGSALSYASALMGLQCKVFFVRFAYDWKPDRTTLMKLYGADVHPSPSDHTECGRALLKEDPQHGGTLGTAISEAVEAASGREDTVYCLGSVLNHILIHQSVIGLETRKQFEMVDDWPDLMIGCLGGGSNFGGFMLPFVKDSLDGKRNTRFLAAQTEASANLVHGEYRYDYADHAENTPLIKGYTLGHKKGMPKVYAEGLRYHIAAPIMSLLRDEGVLDAVSYPLDERTVFQAGRTFMQTEGFLPAPESSYAIAAAIDEALRCKKTGEEKTIAFNISGHGFLDLFAYRKVLMGK